MKRKFFALIMLVTSFRLLAKYDENWAKAKSGKRVDGLPLIEIEYDLKKSVNFRRQFLKVMPGAMCGPL